ncbi:MAG TPA: DUF5712 family protein [Anseongella sp.]
MNARNFKRIGIDSNRVPLWFGKLENNRYYSYRGAEVKQGQKIGVKEGGGTDARGGDRQPESHHKQNQA